jgi:sarcosine oxidase, subunit gamma
LARRASSIRKERGFVHDPWIGERTPPPGAGDADSLVSFAPIAFETGWNVRGNAAQAPFADAVQRTLGCALPTAPGTSARRGDAALLWLGPRSWLYASGARDAARGFDATRHALNAAGGALFDVSASYVGWTIAGAAASRVLARGCPLDLDLRAFPAGHCAQSLLGHIGALFHRPDCDSRFVVLVARSFARDAWHFLQASAATEDRPATQ